LLPAYERFEPAAPPHAPLLGRNHRRGAIYDGWIFYSRWSSERAVQQKRTQAEADRARKTSEMLGGDPLKFLNFYASPPAIHAGTQSLICFGLNAAKHVRIDPPVEE
jgi:hypothetical protein